MRLYIGTYTEPILFGTGEILQGQGDGIYRAEIDCETGHFALEGLVAHAKNPSFLAKNKAGTMLYAVNELKEYEDAPQGAVSAFTVQEDASLVFANALPTKGQDPCHVFVNEDEQNVVVSNFMTGSVCMYALGEDGALAQEVSFFQHDGSGKDPKRQAGPHAHSCIQTPDKKFYFIPDLGMDAVMIYQKEVDGTFTPVRQHACVPGSGPRYGEFHPNGKWFYLIHELASTVAFMRYAPDGSLEVVDIYETLKEPVAGNICADLHITPDGKYLYASNRGDDSIVMFAIDQETGELKRLDWVASGGRTPRQFAILPNGKYLCVGNQDSDNVTVFEILSNGYLQEKQKVAVPTPVCILPWNE